MVNESLLHGLIRLLLRGRSAAASNGNHHAHGDCSNCTNPNPIWRIGLFDWNCLGMCDGYCSFFQQIPWRHGHDSINPHNGAFIKDELGQQRVTNLSQILNRCWVFIEEDLRMTILFTNGDNVIFLGALVWQNHALSSCEISILIGCKAHLHRTLNIAVLH